MKKKVLGLMLLVAGMSFAAQAQTAYTLGVSSNTYWSNSVNWVGGIAPGAGVAKDDIAVLSRAYGNLAVSRALTNDASISLGGIWIGANNANNGRMTLNSSGGSTITLTNTSGGSTFIIKTNNANAGAVGTDVINTPIVLGANLAISNRSTYGGLTISGAISETGSRSVTIDNASSGLITMSASNSYSGGTVLNTGKLLLGNNAALGTGALTINGGTLDVTAARTTDNNNALNLNGDFNFAGANTLNTGTGAVTLGGNRQITVDASTLTIGGVIGDEANTYSLTKAGAGTLTLTNANTYSGGTVLSLGTLNIGHTNALGTGSLTINGGTLANTSASAINTTNAVAINGDFTFSSAQTLGLLGSTTLGTAAGSSRTIANSSAGSLNLDGNIANGTTANQLIKDGVGVLTLTGTNTFSGGLVIKRGTVNLGNVGVSQNAISYGAGTGAITLGDAAGGDAYLGLGSYTLTNAINLASGAAGTKTIGASGATRKATFTGAIALNGNDLTIKGWASSTAGVNVSGGISGIGNLTLTNNSSGNIVLTGASINNTGSITVLGGATSGTNLISAVIGANVTTLTLNNQAKLIVSNANAYAGGTTVSSGLLIGAAADAFGTGGMTVADGATLILKDASTLNDLAALVLGSTSVLGLDFTGADTVGSISLDGGATTLAVGTYTAAALALLNGSGTYTGVGSLTVIPEPATIGMLGLGALVTLLIRRMRTA